MVSVSSQREGEGTTARWAKQARGFARAKDLVHSASEVIFPSRLSFCIVSPYQNICA